MTVGAGALSALDSVCFDIGTGVGRLVTGFGALSSEGNLSVLSAPSNVEKYCGRTTLQSSIRSSLAVLGALGISLEVCDGNPAIS